MTKYFILSEKASIFWDPTSQLKVVSSDKDKPDSFEGPLNARIKVAIQHRHIIEVEAPKGKKAVKALDEKAQKDVDANDDEDEGNDIELKDKKLSEMTDEELEKHYTETFEVSEADLAKFKKLKTKAKVKFLEEEEEEES